MIARWTSAARKREACIPSAARQTSPHRNACLRDDARRGEATFARKYFLQAGDRVMRGLPRIFWRVTTPEVVIGEAATATATTAFQTPRRHALETSLVRTLGPESFVAAPRTRTLVLHTHTPRRQEMIETAQECASAKRYHVTTGVLPPIETGASVESRPRTRRESARLSFTGILSELRVLEACDFPLASSQWRGKASGAVAGSFAKLNGASPTSASRSSRAEPSAPLGRRRGGKGGRPTAVIFTARAAREAGWTGLDARGPTGQPGSEDQTAGQGSGC